MLIKGGLCGPQSAPASAAVVTEAGPLSRLTFSKQQKMKSNLEVTQILFLEEAKLHVVDT